MKTKTVALMGLLAVPLWAFAQPPPQVPALPGAMLAQLQDPADRTHDAGQASAEQLQAMQQNLEQLRQIQATLPRPAAAPPWQPQSEGTDGIAPAVSASPATRVPRLRPTPLSPTSEDVKQLERRLRSVRAQVRSDAIAEAGLITASSASAV